ncbi:MAG TPA: hypothetical protein VNT79_00835, partial [Phycisphaerae bacterium]|nr:hypothetical protein [Phycisphaerae bacterium]
QREKLLRWVDAYADGRLTPDQSAKFDDLLTRSPELRAAVDLQKRIDTSLQRLFVPVEHGPAESLASGNGHVPARTATKTRPTRSRAAWSVAAAACLAVAAGIAWYVWSSGAPSLSQPGQPQRLTLAQAYRDAEARHFEADWLCENDQEFASAFWSNLNQALAMATPPGNVTLTGLTYVPLDNSLSKQAVEILARVGDEGIVVFVDRMPRQPRTAAEAPPGMKFHEKRLRKLALIEISPFEEPVLLPLLSEREIPDSWKVRPGYERDGRKGNRVRVEKPSEPSQPASQPSEAPSKWRKPTP